MHRGKIGDYTTCMFQPLVSPYRQRCSTPTQELSCAPLRSAHSDSVPERRWCPGSSCNAYNHHTRNSNVHDFHTDANTTQISAAAHFFSMTRSANAHKSATEPHVRPGGSRRWGSSSKAAPTGAPLHYSQFPTCRKRGAAVSQEESCSNPPNVPPASELAACT